MLAQARRMAAGVEVPIIVNDRPDVAAACKSWVHLGSADVPLSFARAVLQADQVIGASVGSRGEARSAQAADYWGIGPWRATTTKADAGPPLGASGFRRLVSLSPTRCCIAIGGLIPEDGPLVLRMGGAGLAVASGILGGHDIEGAARRYAERLEAATEGC